MTSIALPCLLLSNNSAMWHG